MKRIIHSTSRRTRMQTTTKQHHLDKTRIARSVSEGMGRRFFSENAEIIREAQQEQKDLRLKKFLRRGNAGKRGDWTLLNDEKCPFCETKLYHNEGDKVFHCTKDPNKCSFTIREFKLTAIVKKNKI